MAGHSKWANIKHRKGAQDKKRAKIFTKIIKEITVASKEAGPDPETNPRLRLAIQNAKGANMPKDTIERAISKGQGGEGNSFQEVTYEGYAPSGIAVFVECTTDNINRTVASVRSIFTKHGGNLGTNGSLEFVFDRKGVFIISKESINQDLEDLEMELIDSGLEEMIIEEDICLIYTSFEGFGSTQNKLEKLNVKIKNAEVQRIANNTKKLEIELAKKVLTLIEKLEEDDDVQNVYHNLELSDELINLLQ